MKVVLVEDHQNLREVLTEILIDEGFEVISLESAEDLDDEPDTHSVDTFILDVNLPTKAVLASLNVSGPQALTSMSSSSPRGLRQRIKSRATFPGQMST